VRIGIITAQRNLAVLTRFVGNIPSAPVQAAPKATGFFVVAGMLMIGAGLFVFEKDGLRFERHATGEALV
jgi:hypothetical protein